MGDYRIDILATGGHGCDRQAKPGEALVACGSPHCPDCQVRAFLDQLRAGSTVKTATLTHWPDTPEAVMDDLLHGVRASGAFR